jgi:hypothetical protein
LAEIKKNLEKSLYSSALKNKWRKSI